LSFPTPSPGSTEAARERSGWGKTDTGPYAGRGFDNIIALLKGKDGRLLPAWRSRGRGTCGGNSDPCEPFRADQERSSRPNGKTRGKRTGYCGAPLNRHMKLLLVRCRSTRPADRPGRVLRLQRQVVFAPSQARRTVPDAPWSRFLAAFRWRPSGIQSAPDTLFRS